VTQIWVTGGAKEPMFIVSRVLPLSPPLWEMYPKISPPLHAAENGVSRHLVLLFCLQIS
jgi:hypothetical protein